MILIALNRAVLKSDGYSVAGIESCPAAEDAEEPQDVLYGVDH